MTLKAPKVRITRRACRWSVRLCVPVSNMTARVEFLSRLDAELSRLGMLRGPHSFVSPTAEERSQGLVGTIYVTVSGDLVSACHKKSLTGTCKQILDQLNRQDVAKRIGRMKSRALRESQKRKTR